MIWNCNACFWASFFRNKKSFKTSIHNIMPIAYSEHLPNQAATSIAWPIQSVKQIKTADQKQVIKYKIDSPCCYTPAWNYKISTQQYKSANFQLHSASASTMHLHQDHRFCTIRRCKSISSTSVGALAWWTAVSTRRVWSTKRDTRDSLHFIHVVMTGDEPDRGFNNVVYNLSVSTLTTYCVKRSCGRSRFSISRDFSIVFLYSRSTCSGFTTVSKAFVER